MCFCHCCIARRFTELDVSSPLDGRRNSVTTHSCIFMRTLHACSRPAELHVHSCTMLRRYHSVMVIHVVVRYALLARQQSMRHRFHGFSEVAGFHDVVRRRGRYPQRFYTLCTCCTVQNNVLLCLPVDGICGCMQPRFSQHMDANVQSR